MVRLVHGKSSNHIGLSFGQDQSESGVLSALKGLSFDFVFSVAHWQEKASGTESDVGAIVPVETSTCLSSNPSAAHGVSLVSVLSKQEQSSGSRVVSNLSVSPVLRTPARDGYHWRKYGQKQVKSPKGSRSYYRCTYSDCCAKKIECSNDSGNVIEIVNKGSHSHEPLRNNSFSPRETRAAAPVISPVTEDSTGVRSCSALSASTKENICESSLAVVEGKRNCENEAMEEPEPKRRQVLYNVFTLLHIE